MKGGGKAVAPVRVVFANDDFLVVDKPSGIATTSPTGRDCLVELVRALDPRAPKLHPTSRLDAEVTGIVTFARTSRGIEHSLAMRRAGRYERLYLALAASAPSPPEGRWDGSISVDARDARKRVISAAADSLVSASTYITRFVSPSGALLALHPLTGRTHQLRVHASHAGVPLLGDVHYGGVRRVTLPDGRIVTAGRVMLHCARVVLPLPNGEVGRFIAPPPEDFVRTLTALGGSPALLTQLLTEPLPDATDAT